MSDASEFEAIIAGLGIDVGVPEAVLDIDAEWFADHPHQRVRFRRLLDGEFGDDVAERLDQEHSGPFLVVVIRDRVRMLVRPLLFEVLGKEDQRP